MTDTLDLARGTRAPSRPGDDDHGRLADRADEYLSAGVAENTRRAYAADARDLMAWLKGRGEPAQLPISPELLGAYLADLADRSFAVATIQRRMAAIAALHKAAGLTSPTSTLYVSTLWRGIRRKLGSAARLRPQPLRFQELVALLSRVGVERTIDLRDRSLLLVAWSAALRRSEIAALRVSDLEWPAEGIVLLLRRSKTDQEGVGHRVGVRRRSHALCPVAALETWLGRRGREDGPVWPSSAPGGPALSTRQIANIIQRRAREACLTGHYSGHSLRSGLVVSARARGASEQAIMKITGHRSLSGLAHYLAVGGDFLEDPAGQAGLA